jgi:hypothetical protein
MKLDLRVPTSLSDIPLHQYQRFLKTFEGEEDYDENYAGMKMLEIFCGLTVDDSLEIKVTDVVKVVEKINKALSEKPLLITRFKIGKTEFGFCPSLDDLSFGEFVDIENSISDWDTMHKAMAVLYRPITERIGNKYKIEKYRGDSWHDAMLQMPSSVAVSAINFFFHLEADLLKATLPYSNKSQISNPKPEEQTTSTDNGVGTTVL